MPPVLLFLCTTRGVFCFCFVILPWIGDMSRYDVEGGQSRGEFRVVCKHAHRSCGAYESVCVSLAADDL